MTTAHSLTTTPFTPAEKKQLRHRWEWPIVALSSMVTVFLVGFAFFMVGSQFLAPAEWSILPEEGKIQIYSSAVVVVLAPIGILLWRKTQVAKDQSLGVTVSDTQLGFVNDWLRYYCDITGIKTLPNVVVANGVKPSSYTSGGIRQHTITLSNIVVELTIDGDRPALRYALAREVGHIVAGHRSVLRQLLTLVTRMVPYASGFLTSAEAYTADRYAAVLAPDCAATYFGVEATGKFLHVDLDMKEVSARAGSGGIFETVNSYLVPLPPITWRVRAIDDFGIFTLTQHSFQHPAPPTARHRALESTATTAATATTATAAATATTDSAPVAQDALPADNSFAAIKPLFVEGYRLTLDPLDPKHSHGGIWMPPRRRKL